MYLLYTDTHTDTVNREREREWGGERNKWDLGEWVAEDKRGGEKVSVELGGRWG